MPSLNPYPENFYQNALVCGLGEGGKLQNYFFIVLASETKSSKKNCSLWNAAGGV